MKVYAVARQSRGDENSKSTAEQEARIREWCRREKHELVGIVAEEDVSGGRPLDRRPGLSAAVRAVEAGEAEVVAVAYFDRLVRSLAVQAEVVERVEGAGGRILTLDVGEVSYATAGGWLSSTMLGAVAEYHRRTTAERVRSAHARLRAEGKWLGGKVPLGLSLEDGRLVPGEHAAAVLDAYRMREDGASLADVQAHLRDATGEPVRSLNIVQRLLRNRVYVELGVVPADLFRRVTARRAPRGKRPSSDLLLARLGVLRCGSCGARMVVATSTGSGGRRVPTYRCPPNGDCGNRQAVTAGIAEAVVVHAARVALRELQGRSGGDTEAAKAEVARAEAAIAGAVEAFDGLGDVAAVKEKMTALRAELEEAQDELERARRAANFTLTTAGEGWDELTQAERRELIRATIERADVMPGRGKERVRVRLAPELRDAQRSLDRAAAAFSADIEGAG